ncbi:MAG TPA: 3-oxoacyl-ACP synthase [Firmicutes bacterium]|jgi:3-oxoacyl-[acyl-carrier-protein] synthase-3|nr:3-oxoacyl-ACP synthase [Bacillota bacterium]
MKKIGLVAIGSYVPEQKLTNADLEKMVDTTDEWITTRTGVKERRIAPEGIYASDLAVKAAEDCLAKTTYRPRLLISSTSTAEKSCPYQASIVAHKLNLTNLAAFDLNAACSGLVYSLAVAWSLMQTQEYEHALITAGENLSMYVDYTDRSSCILFGDGAAALMLSSHQPEHEILAVELGVDPTGSNQVIMGGQNEEFYFRQDGRSVFKFAVEKMGNLIDLLKEKTGITDQDPYFIIPHQANSRILEAVAKNKGLPKERFISNIAKYGNTSSASIGLALKEAWDEQRFTKGDILMLIGFGGGLSWAAAAIRW